MLLNNKPQHVTCFCIEINPPRWRGKKDADLAVDRYIGVKDVDETLEFLCVPVYYTKKGILHVLTVKTMTSLVAQAWIMNEVLHYIEICIPHGGWTGMSWISLHICAGWSKSFCSYESKGSFLLIPAAWSMNDLRGAIMLIFPSGTGLLH